MFLINVPIEYIAKCVCVCTRVSSLSLRASVLIQVDSPVFEGMGMQQSLLSGMKMFKRKQTIQERKLHV